LRLFLLVFLFSLFENVTAQKEVKLFVNDSISFIPDKKCRFPKKIKSLAQLNPVLPSLISYYQTKGYLSFSIDSMIENSHAVELFVYQGERYHLDMIEINREAFTRMKEANLASYINDEKLSIADYPVVSEKLIRYFENSGYPFIEVGLDSTVLTENAISSKLKIERHTFIQFDSIIIKGNAKLAKSYIYPYLGLKRKKKPYNESIIRQIPARISEIPFVSELLPSGVEFVEQYAYLYLFLDKVKTNQFDGYIGLVPVDEVTGKVTVNGELNLNLNNIFSLGEQIMLLWRAPERYSQYLKVHADFQYLFWTPFGVTANLQLDKKDTSYLTMNYLAGIQYSFKGNNFLKLFLDFSTSTILNAGLLTANHLNFTYLDYRKTLYGIEFSYRKVDYLFNPRKGFSMQLQTSAGKMNILKNSKVEEDFYKNISPHKMRYQLNANLQGYIPLHPRWVMLLASQSGLLWGEGIVQNELMKFGGMNTLRGFDENSFEASSFLTGLFELRFIFARRSYLSAFFNAAWYERNIPHHFVTDTPYGFGLGIAFDIKTGMFYLSYALGKQFENPISFKTGKIHFGIVMNF
jgi:outer membrane protein assembly factor BamA